MSSRATTELPNRWFEIGLVVQVIVGAALALIAIGHEPFWHDEVASVSVAERGFGDIFEVLGNTDANSGLYYLGLHVWMWGGDSEGWVRLLSALCVVGTIPVTALLARRLFGEPVGLLAGFMLAGNVFALVYAQQARGYALTLLLTTLATWLFVEALKRDRAGLFAGYAAAAALAVYANLFSGLVIGAHLVSLLFLPWAGALRRKLALTYAAIALITAPLAIFLLLNASDQVSWIERPGPLDLPGMAEKLLSAENRLLGLVYGGLAAIGLISIWARAREGGEEQGQKRWRLSLLAGWVFLPPLLLWALSQAKPLYIDRYLIAVVPALAILAALGLQGLWRGWKPLALAAGVALVGLTAVARIDLEPVDDEDLRAAANAVAAESVPGDGVAYAPAYSRVGIDWYLERADHPAGVPDDFALTESATEAGDLYGKETPAGAIGEELLRHPRVWLVGYPDSDWHPTPEPMLDAGLELLRERYTQVSSRDFQGVNVRLYERHGG